MKDTQLIKWEMHSHTSPVSRCGRLSADRLIELIAGGGYGGVVITDHYDPERFERAKGGAAFSAEIDELFSGYRQAREAGDKLGIQVLCSAELRISAGSEDYLLYGLTEEMALQAGCLVDLSLKQVRERLAPFDVLIVQAHPYRLGQRPADPALLDGVEVFNGNPRHDSHNDQALAFAKQHRLLMTRGSDVHQVQDVGTGHMMLPRLRDEADLVRCLRERA